MTKLDEFLGPLHQGVWEVVIPKQSVTESLGAGWEKSAINIPSPGTIGSYRKGRYHVHETETEWKVHVDNYDPETHPYLHLIDDAPLLLMIGDTFFTLLAGTRKRKGDIKAVLEGQKQAWRQQVIIGICIMLFGTIIISSPLIFFAGIVTVIIPLVIVVLGVVTIWNALKPGASGSSDRENKYRGIGIIAAGFIALFLPVEFWAILVLVVLGIWMFASALILLVRAAKGRAAIPEGFISRVIIAVISLLLGVMIFLTPVNVLHFLVTIVGVLIALLGLTLLVNGIRLQRRMATA